MHMCLVQSTVCMSLLQPQRETYNLFDDVLLLADGASSWQLPLHPQPTCVVSTFEGLTQSILLCSSDRRW